MDNEKCLNEFENDDYHHSCSDNPITVEMENVCNCTKHSEINFIPNEYFYNSSLGDSCDCLSENNISDTNCSCGSFSNPLGNDYTESSSCQCNGLNFFE